MLTAVHNPVSTFASFLDGLPAGSYNWANVVTASDEVVTALGQWPPMKIARWLSGLGAATESFERKTAEALDRTAARTEAVNEAAEGLAGRVEALATKVTEEQQKIAEAIAKFTVHGEAAVQELIEAQAARIAASEQEWTDHLAHQQTLADGHNARMAELEQKSIKVLEAVGTNSTATDYGAHALEQGKAANRWRGIASVVFAIAGVWFIVSSFPWFTVEAASWESSLSRLGVTAAVAGVGAYAARESSQHRKQERAAKKVQLVLIALEPFIANLPETTQFEIRAEAAKAIFVLPEDVKTDDPEAAAAGYLDVLRALVEKVPSR